MRFKKFIILKKEDSNEVKIRIGYPIYHKDLIESSDIKNGFKCVGGGRWHLDYKNKTITFNGYSDDFGIAKKEDIKKAIKNLNDHDYWQLNWLCRTVLSDEIEIIYNIEDPDFSDLKSYKFIIDV